MLIPLSKVKLNDEVKIIYISGSENIQKKLLELGFVKNTIIKPIYRALNLDPTAYLIRKSIVSLRSCDAAKIICEKEEKQYDIN